MELLNRVRILFFAGCIITLAGLLFHPSLLENLKPSGVFQSEWSAAQILIIRYLLLLIGVFSILTGIIVKRSLSANRIKSILFTLIIFGIALAIGGVVLSPTFVEKNFSAIKFLEDHNMVKLVNIQMLIIVCGFLIAFISIMIMRVKFWRGKKLTAVFTYIVVLILFFAAINGTYLKYKFPSNIITSPSQYGKLVDLLLGKDILLSDFDPKSTLVVNRTKVTKAKFPVIDINIHMNSAFQTEEDKKVLSPENLIKAMDSVGVQIIVNTDGSVDGYNNLDKALNLYSRKYHDRFITFYPSWFPPIIVDDNFLSDLPKILENAVKQGVKGNGETWKHFGLKTRDVTGKVIPVDDPRIDPLWAKAGELEIPVLWHMGDPAPMFLPIDRFNERYVELGSFPEWSFYGPRFPSRETLHKGRENVLRKHPNTIIIGCHMGWNSDNLAYASYLLDTYPNYYLDLSTTLSELGRQPYTARRFFIKYQDRILFGTDGGAMFGQKGWTVEKFYRAHFEFLETENEYIDYPMQGAINQGSWKIYGINLPNEVLEKIYYKNAEKLLKIKISDEVIQNYSRAN
jgi:predicted TIM-barrel fold metal-dependent hydrolase